VIETKRSVFIHQQAIQLIPKEHVDSPIFLSNFGPVLCTLFRETKDLSDLEKGTSSLQRAVQICPEGKFYLPYYLQSLEFAFVGRFDDAGGVSDIEDAICYQQNAVHHTLRTFQERRFVCTTLRYTSKVVLNPQRVQKILNEQSRLIVWRPPI